MDPCDGDITVLNMLANKVLFDAVCPQEREISIPFYLAKQVMNPSHSKNSPQILNLEHNKILNSRTSPLQEGEK